MMKREVMQMKYQLMKEEEIRVKRNKVETLSEIRQLIRKHRKGIKD